MRKKFVGKKMNSRGQAALTDSMFLLTVVTSLSTFMFVFVSNYGGDVSDHLLRQYSTDFVTDSLKTILYISTPRSSAEKIGISLAEQEKESDYLLALLKEDFGDSSLTDETKKILRNNVQKIMSPVSDQFDYLFFVAAQDEGVNDYKYFLIYKSEFLCNGAKCRDGQKNTIITSPEESHTFHLCNQDKDNRITNKEIENFVFSLGSSFQANNPVILHKITNESGAKFDKPLTGRVGLIVWGSTLIPDTMLESLHCKAFDEVVAASST